MITTIILSKDRPAQLDLLLRSIERNGGGQFDPVVITTGGEGYQALHSVYPFASWWSDRLGDFQSLIQTAVAMCRVNEFVCFMCDDGILYRWAGFVAPTRGFNRPELLTFSLRLGRNTDYCYPTGSHLPPLDSPWDWRGLVPDFGYPGSIDGHIFRTADMRRMLDGKSFPNPTALECALVEGCNELAAERPLMASYPHSVYVGNPINRVSEQSGVRYGTTYPVTAEECNRRFLAGERIDLERMDFSHVNGAHTEIELKWH